MSAVTVRGYDDAWQVMDRLAAGGEPLKIKFSNCYVDVENTVRIAAQASAQASIMLQKAVRREFSWLKYGKRNAWLNPMERKATEIVAHHHRNGRMIRYDVTSPLNAMAQVVADWDEHGPVHINRTQSLFAAPKKGAPEESWPRTVREVAPGFFGGMASCDRRILGQTMVMGLAAVVLGKAFISESFEVLGPPVGAYAQATLLGKEPTTVAMPDGKPANLDATQLAEVENSADHERQKVRMLISDNIEVPLLRFVVVEAEAVRPALLAMVGDSGNITINGASFSAAQAHAGAKLLRKRSKERRDSGWQTEVLPSPEGI